MSVLMTDANGVGGLAIVRSLGKKGIDITVSSARRDAICFYSKYVKNRLIYPDPEHKDVFFKWLCNTLQDREYDVLISANELMLVLIAENKSLLSKYTRIPIPDLDTIKIAIDKSRLSKFASDNHFPIPKTYFYEELINFSSYDFSRLSEELGLPLIIKPYIGTAASGQILVYETKKIEDIYNKHVKKYGPCMIQEYIRGEKYNVGFIFNFKSKPRRVCVQKTIRQFPVSGGVNVCVETVENNDVLDSGLKLLKKLNYKSIGMMDIIVDERDSTPKLLDLNPRFYASTCLPIAAGIDFPYLIYKLAIEGDIDKDLNYKVGVRCRHIYDDFKHLIKILNSKRVENYNLTKYQTLINFLKFNGDNGYFDWALNDPKPFLSRPFFMIKRKLHI